MGKINDLSAWDENSQRLSWDLAVTYRHGIRPQREALGGSAPRTATQGPGISLTHPAHLYVSVIVLFLNRLPTPKAHCQGVWVRVDAGCCLESPTTLTWAQNHGTQSVPFTWGVWVPNSVAENSLRRIQVSPNVSQVWTETQRSCSYLDVRSTRFSIH